jgi:multidrug efflux pump subunit AcrA (membrane-fusion protein)
LKLPQFPGRTFKATLTTTSDAISSQSRAQLVELMVDNPDKQLSPGAYAQARFDLPLDPDKLVVPASSVIFRNEAPVVALVDYQNHVHLTPISIILDTGTTVEIASGLTVKDRVVESPWDSIANGDDVKIAEIDGKPSDKNLAAQESRGVVE